MACKIRNLPIWTRNPMFQTRTQLAVETSIGGLLAAIMVGVLFWGLSFL